MASRSRWRSRRLLILCYHGFALADEHLWNPSLFVTQRHLESRLVFLAAEGYAMLSLAEGLARLSAGALSPRAVAITVDGGTYDFYAVAYPLFKRLGVPVMLYHDVDHRPVFHVACRYVIWKAWASGQADLRGPLVESGPPLRTEADCAPASSRVWERVWREQWSAEHKHDWLGRFANRMGLD